MHTGNIPTYWETWCIRATFPHVGDVVHTGNIPTCGRCGAYEEREGKGKDRGNIQQPTSKQHGPSPMHTASDGIRKQTKDKLALCPLSTICNILPLSLSLSLSLLLLISLSFSLPPVIFSLSLSLSLSPDFSVVLCLICLHGWSNTIWYWSRRNTGCPVHFSSRQHNTSKCIIKETFLFCAGKQSITQLGWMAGWLCLAFSADISMPWHPHSPYVILAVNPIQQSLQYC